VGAFNFPDVWGAKIGKKAGKFYVQFLQDITRLNQGAQAFRAGEETGFIAIASSICNKVVNSWFRGFRDELAGGAAMTTSLEVQLQLSRANFRFSRRHFFQIDVITSYSNEHYTHYIAITLQVFPLQLQPITLHTCNDVITVM
jgi:hypothetical protein